LDNSIARFAATHQPDEICDRDSQNSNMRDTAHKACSKIIKLEEEVYGSSSIEKWIYESGFITITIIEGAEYNFTRGRFSFSPKQCTDSQNNDFGAPIEIEFSSGKRTPVVIRPSPVCMKTLILRGKYK
jgi:hypothetical protein